MTATPSPGTDRHEMMNDSSTVGVKPSPALLSDDGVRQVAEWAHKVRRVVPGATSWDVPGIEASIRDAFGVWPNTADLMAAVFLAARNKDFKTPKPIAQPKRLAMPAEVVDEAASRARTYAVRCVEHPDEVMPCAACKAAGRRPPEGWRSTVRQEMHRERPQDAP